MKLFLLQHKRLFASIGACLLIGLITLSFQDTPFVKAILDNQEQEPQDTIKKKKNSMTMKEFDRIADDLNKNVAIQLSSLDLAKVEKEMQSALKDVDIEKIMKDIQNSLKSINTEKILADVQQELQHINYNEISAETKNAIANAGAEVKRAMEEVKKVDREELRTELEHARLELEKSRHEFQKINLDKILNDAKQGIEKARTELSELKQMFNEMEKDGLIDPKQGFKIEYKNKNLYINEIKQPERITGKYKKYFKEEHFEIAIDKE